MTTSKAAALLALAGVLTIPATANAGTVETTAYRVLQMSSRNYQAPLKLSGGVSSVICDPYKMRLPISVTCGIQTGYYKSHCYISIDMASNGHATGKVICGRPNRWAWKAHYAWNGKTFTWNPATRIGAVPWPA